MQMKKFEHKKLKTSFQMPEDLSQKQLEQYEAAAWEVLGSVERRTDAILSRAAIYAGISAGIVTAGEGVPQKISELENFPSARVMYWMAEQISSHIRDIKTFEDPN